MWPRKEGSSVFGFYYFVVLLDLIFKLILILVLTQRDRYIKQYLLLLFWCFSSQFHLVGDMF